MLGVTLVQELELEVELGKDLIPADRSGWRWMRDLVRAHPMTSSSVSFSAVFPLLRSCSNGLAGPAAVLDPTVRNGINTITWWVYMLGFTTPS